MDSSRDRDPNNINTSRVDEQDKFRQHFWNKIQAELGACVPEHLKNILKYNNLDNPLSFRDITEEIIDDLENFAKTLLIELIEDDVNVDMKSYFGIFHKKPNNFRFVIGDKMLIRRMVDFIKSTSLSYWNTKSHEEVNSLVNGNSQSSHSIRNNCKNEELIIRKRITQGEKKFSDKMDPSIVSSLRNVIINVTFHENQFKAEILCPLCDHISHLTKCIDGKMKPTWIVSNFYKHFKLHAKEGSAKEGPRESASKNLRTGKKKAK